MLLSWVLQNGKHKLAWCLHKMAMDAKEKYAKVEEGDVWRTVHPRPGEKGRPVLLDSSGVIKAGIGKKFIGQHIDLIPRKWDYKSRERLEKTDWTQLKPHKEAAKYESVGERTDRWKTEGVKNKLEITENKELNDLKNFSQKIESIKSPRIKKDIKNLYEQAMSSLNGKENINKETILKIKSQFDKLESSSSIYQPNYSRNVRRAISSSYVRSKYIISGLISSIKGKGENGNPLSLAGVSLGNEMSHQDANTNKPNPGYYLRKDEAYKINCQSCVVAYEARRRGFNVEALPNNKYVGKDGINGAKGALTVSKSTTLAFYDPKTGLPPVSTPLQAQDINSFVSQLDGIVKSGERHHLILKWQRGNGAHITTITKTKDGELLLYDPQTGKEWKGNKDIAEKSYLMDSLFYTKGCNKIYRVDNMCFNPMTCQDILRESKKWTS